MSTTNVDKIPFLSLRPGEDAPVVQRAIQRVIARGWFILGPELEGFEQELAAASGTQTAVGVGNATDGLALILRALGIGPGDEVITSPLSAAFGAFAIMMAGARPVFADIDPRRLTIDPQAVAAAITPKTAAIMPVHLYGQPADMPPLLEIAARHNLAIVEDAAQAHLATCNGKPVGTMGMAGALSFYPTKNLGALGDGGAVITDDRQLADKLKRLRNGGQTAQYRHEAFGVNSRLDEMQAAILRERLALLPAWTARRRALAERYYAGFAGMPAELPFELPPRLDAGHVHHLFPVRSAKREAVRAHLLEHGVETLIHYPMSIARQRAFDAMAAPCPVTDRVCDEIFSLPLYPALADAAVDRIVGILQQSV